MKSRSRLDYPPPHTVVCNLRAKFREPIYHLSREKLRNQLLCQSENPVELLTSPANHEDSVCDIPIG
ncbi:hypothetical protein M514_10618 [Trichuris suis]|uniref:Uncharacterized protein n=1 Tax=Trichuris suis TaxID=68888 RepID=A0A085NJR1_9BILA|nr:hypothetical protein M513_10618 [Trichuris suis]KFD69707.1 hypothetical protein M514_10618 [Trichuris suis]